MAENNKYIRFDWAAKRMLRDKANFAVLEGLMTVLLNQKVTIVEILENNEKRDIRYDKFPPLRIVAQEQSSEFIFVELCITRKLYYLECVRFGLPITEHISLGDKYNQVKKVYSINILYFDLGQGADYLYHGVTNFTGVHTHDTLRISTKEEGVIRTASPNEIFPEYFIIRVNEFNKVATTPLEEWIEYLKTGNINAETKAPGLAEARQRLQYLSMSDSERRAYDEHINAIMIQNDVLDTAKMEGHEEGYAEGHAEGVEKGLAEGRAEGRAEGLQEGVKQTAKKMKSLGISIDTIAQATGLSKVEIEVL